MEKRGVAAERSLFFRSLSSVKLSIKALVEKWPHANSVAFFPPPPPGIL